MNESGGQLGGRVSDLKEPGDLGGELYTKPFNPVAQGKLTSFGTWNLYV